MNVIKQKDPPEIIRRIGLDLLVLLTASGTVAVAFVAVYLNDLVDAVALIVVVYCGLYCLFSENGAVKLNGGKSVERFNYCLIRERERFVDALALDKLGCHRRGRDRRAAAEGLELYVNYDVVLNFEVYSHYIAAGRVSDLADSGGIFYFTNVSRICEMVHNFCAVVHIILSFPVIVEGAHLAQARNDGRELFENVIDVLVGVLMRKGETERAVRLFVRQTDRKKDV